ncbi:MULTISPECIES: hypothetical protein [Pectobacterium]|uniref:hypothetical protein n=1 Tax=Pectobacterium TaxID=122277 RepID=UPI001BB2E740|nr:MULTISPECIES: hypothetical protein [Pectobacterium]MCL6324020.1 hypothetical protein [Pectobacterium polaris]
MAIRRGPRPESQFYTLDKSISEDLALSWGARGLLIYLLGKPDNWEVSVADLINQTKGSGKPAGRDAVRGLINELKASGYMHADTKRNTTGSFDGVSYVVSEVPRISPETDNPATVKPETANPPLISNELKQELNINKKTLVSSGDDASKKLTSSHSDEFESCWKAYPKREGSNPKNHAFKHWQARIKEGVTPDELLAGTQRYAAFCVAKGQSGTPYVMQAQRFYGPSREWENSWVVSSQPQQLRPATKPSDTTKDMQSRDYGTASFSFRHGERK